MDERSKAEDVMESNGLDKRPEVRVESRSGEMRACVTDDCSNPLMWNKQLLVCEYGGDNSTLRIS